MKKYCQRIGSFLSIIVIIALTGSCSNITDESAGSDTAQQGARRVASWNATSSGMLFSGASYVYNDQGQLIEIRKTNYNAKTGAVIGTFNTIITYNDKGQISGTFDGGTAQVAKAARTFSYDEQGRVVRQSMNLDGTAFFTYEYSWQDDELVQIKSNIDEKNFGWYKNRLGLMESEGWGNYSYSYNNSGKCTRMTVSKPAVRNEYEYNDQNELVRVSFFDEVHCAYTQNFSWESGEGNYDVSDVLFSHIYQIGVFKHYGVP